MHIVSSPFTTKNEKRVTCSPRCARAYQRGPEVRAKQKFIGIMKTLSKKQLKPKIQKRIFNRLLKEEREKSPLKD